MEEEIGVEVYSLKEERVTDNIGHSNIGKIPGLPGAVTMTTDGRIQVTIETIVIVTTTHHLTRKETTRDITIRDHTAMLATLETEREGGCRIRTDQGVNPSCRGGVVEVGGAGERGREIDNHMIGNTSIIKHVGF